MLIFCDKLFEKHDITSSQYISKEFGEVTFNMDRISAVDSKRQCELASLLRC
jgi:hypothetical protein